MATAKRAVLVTGAAGRIGSYFAEHSHDRYDLRLMIMPGQDRGELEAYGQILEGDLGDPDRMKDLCGGIDTVLHLAGNPDPAAVWHDLLDANIIGTYNTFVAARAAGCRRIVFASSIHAVSGYPEDVQVKTTEPVNPGDLYGVTKCFGEALGRYMAEQEGISVIALRIGAFQPLETARGEGGPDLLDTFVSHRDLNTLICCAIDVDNLRFAILHGLSNNKFKRLDLSDTRSLVGYNPIDDVTQENPQLRELHLAGRIPGHNASDSGQASGIREELTP